MLAAAGPLERDEGDVVLLLPAPADELVELLEEVVEQLGPRTLGAISSRSRGNPNMSPAGPCASIRPSL